MQEILIQRGCSWGYCTFCFQAMVSKKNKEKKWSISINDVIKNIKEDDIFLMGTNLLDYDSNGKNILDLLKKIENIKNVKKIRTSPFVIKVEPLTEISKFIKKSKKLNQYLGLCIQSYNDKILKLMGRRYREEDVKKIINIHNGKNVIPSIMIGFPGETRDDFLYSIQNLSKLGCQNIHYMGYWDWYRLCSYKLPNKVNIEEKVERIKILKNYFNVINELEEYTRDNIAAYAPSKNRAISTPLTDELMLDIISNNIKIIPDTFYENPISFSIFIKYFTYLHNVLKLNIDKKYWLNIFNQNCVLDPDTFLNGNGFPFKNKTDSIESVLQKIYNEMVK